MKGYFVQHTHWDREWYFTAADALVLSDSVFMEVLDELQKNKTVNFCLDGQSSIVDEFIEIHPEKLSEIRELVKEGRLFVGPWFTQTDALLVDDESIMRNLIIGISDTKVKYGEPMMLGYLPDTFGFNAQLPTLLQQFGIDNFLSWRGANYDRNTPSPYFHWKGLGDKMVIGANFPFGYMTGLLTVETEATPENMSKYINERIDPYMEFTNSKGDHIDVLIPSGIDQKNIVRDFDKSMETINSLSKYDHVISDYPSFINVLRQKDNLPLYQGDLRESVYSRIHRTISSVRMSIKLKNYQLEQKLIRRIEPLVIIAEQNGIVVGKGLVTKAWKKLLECQAHDSIGGCVSDNVAEDIYHRLKEAEELIEGIENVIVKRFADYLNLENNQVLVFNTEPTTFSGYKDVHIVASTKDIQFTHTKDAVIIDDVFYPQRDNVMRLAPEGYEFFNEPEYYELFIRVHVDVPAFGYTIITFEDASTKMDEPKLEQTTSITNSDYTIHFKDGKLELEHKGKTITDFLSIIDDANDGDTYDYSPLANDKAITCHFNTCHVEVSQQAQTLILEGVTSLPYDLEDRLSDTPNFVEEHIRLELTLSKGSNMIEGKIVIENKALSHRLRLKLNVSSNGNTSFAQIQNGFVKNTPKDIPTNWQDIMVEKPVNLEICDKSVSVENNGKTYTFFTDGIKEYECEDGLYLTLMATTGELGKPNLAWRPGRASGDTTNEGHIMMPTPLAQEIGERVFTFGLMIEDHTFDELTVAATTIERLTQSISYQKQTLNVFIHRLDNKIFPLKDSKALGQNYSGLEMSDDLLISAIYPSYFHDDKFIIRLKNPTATQYLIVELNMPKGQIVNALEEELDIQTFEAYDYLNILVEV